MQKFWTFALLFAFSGAVFAQQQTEEQCKRNLDNLVSGIEFASQQKGIEPRAKELTIKDIREIQKTKGSCSAEQQVRQRLLN